MGLKTRTNRHHNNTPICFAHLSGCSTNHLGLGLGLGLWVRARVRVRARARVRVRARARVRVGATVNDARPGFLQSGLDDKFYQCALVDASAKHKLLPLARALWGRVLPR